MMPRKVSNLIQVGTYSDNVIQYHCKTQTALLLYSECDIKRARIVIQDVRLWLHSLLALLRTAIVWISCLLLFVLDVFQFRIELGMDNAYRGII